MSDRILGILLLTNLFLLAVALAVVQFYYRRMKEELKRNDELFIQSERFRELFEQTEVGLTHTDMKGRFVFLNRSAAKTLGFEMPEDLYDDRINSLQFYADPSEAEWIREQLRNGKRIKDRVIQIKGRDGRLSYVMVSLHARFDAKGNPVGFESIGHDVTDRVMLEEELANYSENLDAMVNRKTDEILGLERKKFDLEKLAAVGETVSTLVQSLAGPLSEIQDDFYYIRDNVDFDANERRMLELGHKEGLRIERLMKESLDFTRPEKLLPVSQDVHPILDHAAGWHEQEFAKRGIALLREYASGIPPVDVDFDRFSQVITNLLQNAIESVQDRQGRIVLKTEYASGDEFLRISVEDNGAGISEEDRGRLFDPFFTTKREGTGLGLPVVRKIVKALHGTIGIESRPGEGTRVRIELPVDRRPSVHDPV